MDYPFEDPDFASHSLVVRIPGIFSRPRLVVDGVELVGKRGKFSIRDDQGIDRPLKLKPSLLDPLPKLDLDGTVIALAAPLEWYEYVWMGLPLALVFGGGALGGGFGAAACYVSAKIFRSDRETGAKYALSALTTLATFVGFFGFVAGAVAIGLLPSEDVDQASRQVLEEVAMATNADLPRMVDDQTELVRLEGLEGVLVHHYRLTKIAPGSISEEKLVEAMVPAVSEAICANEESRARFLKNGVTLRYAYSDAQSGFIVAFDIVESDCL